LEGALGRFTNVFDSSSDSVNCCIEVIHEEGVAADKHDRSIQACGIDAIEEAANFVVLTQ
jgi:hypothetical protein